MKIYLATIALLALTGHALAGETLEAASARWAEAFNAHDLDGLVAIYSEDAMLLPPNAEPIKGTDNIRATWAGFIEGGGSTTLETISMKSSGDVGYNIGHYALFDAEGNTLEEGKFTEVWNRVDGAWRMVSDQWSSSAPCVPAEPAE